MTSQDARLLRSIRRMISGVRMSCMRQVEFVAWDDDRIGARHEAVVDHRDEIGEVDAVRIPEADDDDQLIQRRNPAGDERVRRVDCRHPLEVDVRFSELRTYVVDVVGHAAKDRIGDRLCRVTSCSLVAVDLLDPLQVDDGNDADLQVGVARDVDLVCNECAMQPFIEQIGP